MGVVAGAGCEAALRNRCPGWVLGAIAAALLAANTINIGADLSGMADAAELLTGVSSHLWVVIFGIGIAVATIRIHYGTMANVLKWLALVLFVSIVEAVQLGPPWRAVGHATLVPSIPGGPGGWATLVAILGTTISPYLFFWQASEEVEEEKSIGRKSIRSRHGATHDELIRRKIDVGAGTFFSNLVMFFIILTTALTLHAHGLTKIETSRQVAEALTPLAGKFATLLYTVGLIGTGLLAIPTLAGSAAYAVAEVYGWRQGMDASLRGAPAFYAVVSLAMICGMGMDYANLNAVRTLYWSAVINGMLAPFLLLGILFVASDARLMQGQPSPILGRVVVGITTATMFAAAAGMFLF